jgi:DNA-binding GntR family transcriptional regulator
LRIYGDAASIFKVKQMSNVNNGTVEFPLPQTMGEFIYEHLKKSILSNELKAKQKISEIDIARHYKVSRTPVREALLKLEAKRFPTMN